MVYESEFMHSKGNEMGTRVEKRREFDGTQSQERLLSALPIRINYQTPRYGYDWRPEGNDWLLYIPQLKEREPVRESVQLDPYAVRSAFDSVDSPESAVRFLSEAGRFWVWESVLWSQFREWQDFFKWLQIDHDIAVKNPLGRKAWETAFGRGNSFFAMRDEDFTRSRFPPGSVEEIGFDRFKEEETEDHRQLSYLRTFAYHPGFFSNRPALDVLWYDDSDPNPPGAQTRRGESVQQRNPYISIPVCYVLEAIAATIYADRAHGLKYGKCKHCGKLFKIESGHNQQFCPAPRHLKSSPCKNAFYQKKRRDAQKAARRA